MANLKGKRILEVGCGAGEFLAMLSGFPVLGYGIENKIELVNAAQNRGLNVYHDFADCIGHKIHGGPYDAFVQFNFIEHQPRPNDMVKCIHDNLVPDGWGLVTAPSFEYIMKNCVYEVMRDHIAYYTIRTLSHLFSKNGFNIMHSELVNGGDTISLIVQKRRILREDVFKPNYDAVKKEINDFVKERTDAGKKLSLWGASHQCFTAVSLLSEPSRIDYIIDSAPFKQGCVSPVSHIEIVSPAHFGQFPTDSILIVAPGYTEEIAKNIRVRFGENVDIYALRTDRIEYMNV
jgi:SAM-dependent methyltransferase